MSTVHMKIKCSAQALDQFNDLARIGEDPSTDPFDSVHDYEYDDLSVDQIEMIEVLACERWTFYGDHDPYCETDAKKFVAFEGEFVSVTVNCDGEVMTEVCQFPGMNIVIAPEKEIRYFQLLKKVKQLFGEEE